MKKIVKLSVRNRFDTFCFPPINVPEYDSLAVEAKGYMTTQRIVCETCLDKGRAYSCTIRLDDTYINIIGQLKDAGLLDKNYKLRCCRCYFDDKNL